MTAASCAASETGARGRASSFDHAGWRSSVIAPACLLALACVAAVRIDPAVAAAPSPAQGSAGPPPANPTHEDEAIAVRFERLGSEHGLSHNAVFAILQDRRGFMWFGTQDGLDRYDGLEFVTLRHDPADPRSVSSSWITALLEDHAGTLWIGTRGGLDRITTSSVFERFALSSELAGASITALAEDHSGRLWVGTDEGLASISPGRDAARVLKHDPGNRRSLAADFVRRIQVAPDGQVWVLTERAYESNLHRLADDGVQRIPIPHTRAFHVGPPGELWLDRTGPAPRDLATAPDTGRSPLVATAFLEDAGGRLWIGTYNGLWLRPAGADAVLPVSSGRSERSGGLTSEVTAIAQDRAGAVWVGTYGGVLRHDPNRKEFEHIGHQPGDPDTLSSNAVSSIYQDPSGRLWVGTYGTGLDEIDRATGAVRHHRHRPGDPTSLCHDYIYDLSPSARATLWIASHDALCSFEQGVFRRHHLGQDIGRISVVRERSDGALWLGSGTGLYAYVPRTGDLRFVGGAGAGLVEPIDAMHATPDGILWVASGDSGDLASFDPETGAVATFRGVEATGIWDIVSAGGGALWLATGAGAIRFDRTRGVADRLARANDGNGSVYYSVLLDEENRPWFGTNKGLVRYDPAGPETGFRRYDLGDGLGSLEFNRHATFRTGSGELIFGGMSGLTIFHPASIRDNPYVPPVALTAVNVLSRSGERRVETGDAAGVTLEPDDYAVSFEFAALNFTQSHKNRYAYTLDGFDDGWIQAETRRSVRYTSLPPGTYRFRVKGANNDGLWNEADAGIALTVLPPLWQTGWFRTVLVVALVGGLAAAHRARTRRLLELHEMRLRIASDLHDELGSDLSGIALATGMIAGRDHLTPRERRRLEEVSASAVRVTEGLRDIVWYINPEHDTLAAMERRMKAVAASLLDGTSYRFVSEGVPAAARVAMDRRRHLFLIFKELLHNVLRHARATDVEITLRVEDDRLTLVVADDGVGFAIGEQTGGTGLKSMRRRAAALGGELTIESRTGRGTRARVTAPLARARRGARARRALG